MQTALLPSVLHVPLAPQGLKAQGLVQAECNGLASVKNEAVPLEHKHPPVHNLVSELQTPRAQSEVRSHEDRVGSFTAQKKLSFVASKHFTELGPPLAITEEQLRMSVLDVHFCVVHI